MISTEHHNWVRGGTSTGTGDKDIAYTVWNDYLSCAYGVIRKMTQQEMYDWSKNERYDD